MKIPLSLIKKFIEISLPPQEIANLLTLAGIEVDKIENEQLSFSHVVVGQIISVEKHPGADKLVLTQVHDGKEPLSIVCGASNCKKGMKVALAKVGSSLTDENGKNWKIKKTNIRGVDSWGMLCSKKELGLAETAEGILELPEEFSLGDDLSSLLQDPVFDISLTPNLGHCASALGIARELAAITDKPLLPLPSTSFEEKTAVCNEKISVLLEAKKGCLRYACRLMEDVQAATTPFWLKQALENSGLRSLHPVVDVMNYLMLAYGHPLHAFDYDKIEGGKIFVENNQEVRSVEGLDGKEYILPLDTLLISDQKKPLAIAGILGLKNSAIEPNSKNILIEAAHFDPLSIRKSCKALALKTESSFRFERGSDIEMIPTILNQAVSLIHSLCKAKAGSRTIDIYPKKVHPPEIHFRTKKANEFLGTKLSPSEMENIFRRLQMTTKQDLDLIVSPPTYRNDIKAEIDLFEEIARIYGYNNIEKRRPLFPSSTTPPSPLYLFEKKIRKNLCSQGMQELITSDLISPKLASMCEEMHFAKGSLISTLHSKSADFSIVRPSLLPSLLQVVQFNLDHQRESICGFEIGKVHWKDQLCFIEESSLSLILVGKHSPHHWGEKARNVDFYDIKGILENLFSFLGISSISFVHSLLSFLHPERQVDIHINKEKVGVVGEVHPSLLNRCDIKEKVYFAEINTRLLLEAKKEDVRFHEIPLFPSSERDWTFVLPTECSYSKIKEFVDKLQSPLLENCFLLDLYEDPASLQKKLTLRFIYRNSERTITLEEVEREHETLMNNLSNLLKNSCTNP